MPKPQVSFSTLLPLLSLTLWFVLVPTQTAYVYARLTQLSHGAPEIYLRSGDFTISVPRSRFLAWSLNGIAAREAHFVEAMHLPGMLGEIFSSLPTSWPDSWYPASWTLDAWRFVSWPLFCPPFWWFAGLGIDTLLAWRHPRWWTLLIGSLLCAGFLILLIGIRSVESPHERATDTWIWCGCCLWVLLFAAFPAAWLRRAFAGKHAPVQAPAELPVL